MNRVYIGRHFDLGGIIYFVVKRIQYITSSSDKKWRTFGAYSQLLSDVLRNKETTYYIIQYTKIRHLAGISIFADVLQNKEYIPGA